jgi:putative flavoprotein involved in K+ transport
MIEKIDTVVVGGGQAGLAMSYHLKQSGREHVILEWGRAAQSWRSERWDSLMFQFPSSSIQLSGLTSKGSSNSDVSYGDFQYVGRQGLFLPVSIAARTAQRSRCMHRSEASLRPHFRGITLKVPNSHHGIAERD